MRVSRLYICLLIALIYNPLHSQVYLPPEVLSVADGLSSQHVNCLALDQKGFLWAGTRFGLNRYNGYTFRHFFTTASGNGYTGIQVIHKIKCDAGGNLWILNNAGVNRIDHRSGEISRFPVTVFDAVYKPESVLTDIYPAEDGNIWILSDRSLTLLSVDQVINTYLIPPELLQNGIVPTCVVADPNGNIWIGTTGGLLLFSMQQKIFKEMVGDNSHELLSDNQVNCLFLDHENSLWVGTRNGLNQVDPVDYAFYHYFPGNGKSLQPANRVLDIASANQEELVLATDAGIVRFNKAGKVFEKVFESQAAAVGSVAVDSSGIIWGGTMQGIIKIRKPKLRIRNFTTQSAGFKLAHDHITALAHGADNNLFIGYYRDGFSVVNTKTFTGAQYSTLNGAPVVGFYPFRNQEYLILTEHDIEVFGSSQINRTSMFNLYPFMKRELVENVRLNCLFYDGANAIWLGTSNGIQRIRIDSARHVSQQSFAFQNQRANIGEVFDIRQDSFGNIWLATDNGLFFYNPAKGNYNRYTPYDINLLNTEHKIVYSIIPDKSGVLWVGTSGGAYRFDAASREFTAITDKPEVMNAIVRTMNLDKNGNIWIGTETGLYYYIKNSNTVKSYDLKEGLLNDFYTAIYSGNDNKVFLGGYLGLSMIDLPESSTPARIPDLVITGIRYLENGTNMQDLYYQVPDTIILPWNRKALQVEFAVLDLSRPELNQFRYSFGKIKNNSEWHNLGSQNYIVLDHLSPGKYIIRIAGTDSEMNWNNKGASLVIIVQAPYWRSKFGLALVIVIGLFMVIMFFRFWIRQFFNLSRENQEREMFAKQIMLQKEELTLKNKSITDSINYAKRIQTAMLPPYKLFKSVFPSSFILFMPKDIVSGDFYWVNKLGNRIFIAAVDCTGHGVPGAFMSIIGFELFRKITNIEGLTRPSDILNRLNDDFHEIFKDVDNVVLRDGMDVAFCSIDKKDMILEYAGAFNPLYLIRDNKIMEVKGDRFAIGLDETNFKEQTFKNHIIPIQKEDIIYVFSDGFSDQFGGPDGKKYKYRRFRHLLLNLHQLPMEKQHEILENNVIEWRGEQDQVDDILVIGIKIDF